MVPIHSGVLSALGMLMAPRGRHLSHALHGVLSEIGTAAIDATFTLLQKEGSELLVNEGVALNEISAAPLLELRYRGQSYTLSVPWEPKRGIEHHANQFHQAHLQRYGHDLRLPIELVTLRLKLTGPEPQFELQQQIRQRQSRAGNGEGSIAIYYRAKLMPNQPLAGPALIIDPVSTTWLAPGWSASIDNIGNLLLERD